MTIPLDAYLARLPEAERREIDAEAARLIADEAKQRRDDHNRDRDQDTDKEKPR
jgi:hypothetical protein